MFFFLVSFLAGVLTILAPCILPLLPIVIGSSNTKQDKKISLKSIRIIVALSISVILFTLLLKASTLLIDIPNSFWTWFSGIVIIILGLVMIFPEIWVKIPLVNRIKNSSNQKLASGHSKKNSVGDYIVGVSLGPVFSTCSPTYLFIIATVLPASFVVGFVYLLGFTLGLALSLLLVAYFGQSIVNKITTNHKKAEITKKIFGFVILVVGLLIITGLDKKFEAWVLDSGYGATINFEEKLIDNFGRDDNQLNMLNENNINNLDNIEESSAGVNVPRYLKRVFDDTNWNKVDSSVEKALSGGPGKDGIPSIDNPKFIPISEFKRDKDIQAIVLKDKNVVKVYPYNILTWHEIVNDTVGNKKVSVTFCPLCGSAVVYNRKLSGGETTFGVSGSLIESNMVMYDRDTESLWQQSTGEAIAGDYFGEKLDLIQFQLLTIQQVLEKHPNALILSEDTGYSRNYGRNPYSGYDESEQFIFAPSRINQTYGSKEIMVAFEYKNIPVSIPMKQIKEGQEYIENILAGQIKIYKKDGDIVINGVEGESIPFYFEMWFSWAVQNEEIGEVIDLS